MLDHPNFFHLEKLRYDQIKGAIVATGKAWLERGGNLYIILEDEAKGVALGRELDSERTWVDVR